MFDTIITVLLLLLIFFLGVLFGIILCTLYILTVAPALVKEMRLKRKR